MHVIQIISAVFARLSILALLFLQSAKSAIIPRSGPPGWIDSERFMTPVGGMECNAYWHERLSFVFDPAQNPAAHNPESTYTSLLKMCAAESWGGNPFGNAGGVCSTLTPDPRRIMFDFRVGPVMRASHMLLMICRMKCRCVVATDEAGGATIGSVFRSRTPMALQTIHFYRGDPTSPHFGVQYIGQYNRHMVITRSSACYSILTHTHVGESVFQDICFRAVDANVRALKCEGATVEPRSSELRPVAYYSARDFCAASLYAGNPSGNAGITCVAINGRKTPSANAFYQHPGVVSYESLYCLAICSCGSDADKQTSLETMGMSITRDDSGFTFHHYIDQPEPCRITFAYTSSGHVSLSRSDSCPAGTGSGSNNGRTTVVYGDAPIDPAVELVGPPNAISGSCSVASMGCRSRQDCGGEGCNCIISPSEMKKTQSGTASAVFSKSECISGAIPRLAGLLAGDLVDLRSSLLGKRADAGHVGTELDVICPCNVTYVSRGCCMSNSDGVVWEKFSLKRGVLGLEV